MARHSPLQDALLDHGAIWMPYGPGQGDARANPGTGDRGIAVPPLNAGPATTDSGVGFERNPGHRPVNLTGSSAQPAGADLTQAPVDVLIAATNSGIEYAALRGEAALFDLPQRGVLECRGRDRREFLNRMLTQDLKTLAPGQVARSFWLNRKGRIDADLALIELGADAPGGERTLLDVDVFAARRALAGLSSYVIADDVTFSDLTENTHRLALHGPRALDLLARAAEPDGAARIAALAPHAATWCRVAGHDVIVWRDESAGEPGAELLVSADGAVEVFQVLVDPRTLGAVFAGSEPKSPRGAPGARVAGWHAWNVARLEHGTPLYYVDFGPDSLPAETGVLTDRVSMTKGCYLGQEVVARMHARGHPKQLLVGLRALQADAPTDLGQTQPVTGSGVFETSDPLQPIGVVTSSCSSPMLGYTTICLATVRYAEAVEERTVWAEAEGGAGRIPFVMSKSLRFWQRESAR